LAHAARRVDEDDRARSGLIGSGSQVAQPAGFIPRRPQACATAIPGATSHRIGCPRAPGYEAAALPLVRGHDGTRDDRLGGTACCRRRSRRLLEVLCLTGAIDKITMQAPHLIVRDLWRMLSRAG
jgi:hypothetical protein